MHAITKEPAPPRSLRETQEWFGSIIARPIDQNSKMDPVSPQNKPMEQEAKQYILPSPTMQPHQRIELYNQQYWWRLLTILHENFPLVVRLFGYFDFNQIIGIPYLDAYPPHTWSLNPLGYRMVRWIEECYNEKDKQLTLDAASVDQGYNDGFLAEELPSLSMESLPVAGDIQSIIKHPLTLQPSVHLYKMDYHLFPFRTAMIEHEPEYWEEHDFPELAKEKNVCAILYRSPDNHMCWEEIHPGEYFLLSLFQKGCSIEEACDKLEDQDPIIVDEAIENLAEWFQKWVIRGLLARS